jgi:hypothetical protein
MEIHAIFYSYIWKSFRVPFALMVKTVNSTLYFRWSELDFMHKIRKPLDPK